MLPLGGHFYSAGDIESDSPPLLAFDRLEEEYSDSEGLLLIIDFQTPNGVFTRESLKIIQQLTDQAWHIPYSTRVDSVTNFQHIRADGDDLFVNDLVMSPESLTEADVAEIRAVALAEPSLLRLMVSEDGRAAGIYLSMNFPSGKDAEYMPEIVTIFMVYSSL